VKPDDVAAYTAAAVRGYLVAAGLYLEAVAQQNPGLTAAQLLARADVRASLQQSFTDAEAYVREQVTEAWEKTGASVSSPVLADLVRDIDGIYGRGPEYMERLLRESRKSVRETVEGYARNVALRNSMTVQFAIRAGTTEAQVGEAAKLSLRPRKRWKAHPENPSCCFWCRRLHGVTIGLHDSFLSYLGGPAALSGTGRLTRPPRPYAGRLQAPPLHPWCECELVVVTEDAGTVAEEAGEGYSALPSLVSSAEVRAMPEEKYRLLVEYLRAAMHELGRMLQRLERDARA
jgi:hypothetical protein